MTTTKRLPNIADCFIKRATKPPSAADSPLPGSASPLKMAN
jgi:hypothetical protein